MSNVEFGVFDNFGSFEMASSLLAADVYERHIREAQEAEQLGYKYYFFIEHQNAVFGQITSPTVYLAALAQHTSSLRFGPMVYQLPMHHPMRLAQDAAMLDHLSRGRLEFGTGLGIHEHEFLRWNLPFYDRRAMAVEAMDIIIKAWTEDTVTYQGNYWQFDEAIPRPKPYQQPHPPVWVGAHSKESFDYAVEHGFHVGQNIDVDTTVAEKFDYFRSAWKEQRGNDPLPRILMVRHVHVADTDEQAKAEAEPELLKGFIQQKERELIASTRIGWGSSPRGTGTESTPDQQQRGQVFQNTSNSYDFWIDSGLAVVGSPDTIIRKLEEKRQLIGFDLFLAQHHLGEMPPDQSLRSMRLFGEKVIPAFA